MYYTIIKTYDPQSEFMVNEETHSGEPYTKIMSHDQVFRFGVLSVHEQEGHL